MIDQPAPFLSAEEHARRRAAREADGFPVVDVSTLGRFEIARRPMTAAEAATAFLHAALVFEDRPARGYPAR